MKFFRHSSSQKNENCRPHRIFATSSWFPVDQWHPCPQLPTPPPIWGTLTFQILNHMVGAQWCSGSTLNFRYEGQWFEAQSLPLCCPLNKKRLIYRHWWNTKIFPVAKILYPVKTQFLSFTCEDIMVVMTTSVLANEIYKSYMPYCYNITYFLYFSTKIRMCVRSIFF